MKWRLFCHYRNWWSICHQQCVIEFLNTDDYDSIRSRQPNWSDGALLQGRFTYAIQSEPCYCIGFPSASTLVATYIQTLVFVQHLGAETLPFIQFILILLFSFSVVWCESVHEFLFMYLYSNKFSELVFFYKNTCNGIANICGLSQTTHFLSTFLCCLCVAGGRGETTWLSNWIQNKMI